MEQVTDKLNKIIEYYNEKQDKWTISHFKEYDDDVLIVLDMEEYWIERDIYSWIFNPKYRVCEMFEMNSALDLFIDHINYKDFSIIQSKQPEEIINYLYNQLEKDNETNNRRNG